MNCNEFTEKILDHALLEQTVADPEVAAHLDECPVCRERLEFERSLAEGFNAIVAEEPPIELAGRVLNIPDYIAAEEKSAPSARQPAIAREPVAIPPDHEDPVSPPAPRERPLREVPWWQAFWFKAGVSFAAAGFLLAIGVSQMMNTGSGVADKNMELARSSPPAPSSLKTDLSDKPAVAAVPAPAPADGAADGVDAGAEVVAMPAAQSEMMMAAAPAETEESKARIGTPAEPPAPPPVFKAQPDAVAAAPSEPLAATRAQPPVIPTVSASVAGATVKKNEQDSEKPPVVIGESLMPGKTKRTGRQDTQLAFAKTAPVSPAASVQPKGLTGHAAPQVEREAARPESVRGVGEILLLETSEKERNQRADELAPDFEEGFAPPPPSKSAAEAFRKDFIEESATGVSPRKQARIEEIMAAHSSSIQAGKLDIDQWVLYGWITVRERIRIAPPHGMKWVAVRSGNAWKAELR